MALVSPGVELTVIDESQYLPSAVSTIPLVVIATAENKTINGLVAAGTTKANANKVYGITSQRELSTTFGLPKFRRSAADTPLHADEMNEYGLMAAYSALGIGNRAWVIRANIDLDALEGTVIRPRGSVANNVNWFDLSTSKFGLFEFDPSVLPPASQFIEKSPIVLDVNDPAQSNQIDTSVVGATKPQQSVGLKGDYAAILGDKTIDFWYKDSQNAWQRLGSEAWANDVPVVTSTKNYVSSSLSSVVLGSNLTVNGTTVTISGTAPTDMNDLATRINNALTSASNPGVVASVDSFGFLQFKANAMAKSGGPSASSDGKITLSDGMFRPLEKIGIMPASPAVVAGTAYGTQTVIPGTSVTYTWTANVNWSGNSGTVTVTDAWVANSQTFSRARSQFSTFTSPPDFSRKVATRDGNAKGSIWVKTSAEGNGVNFVYKRYNAFTDTWRSLATKTLWDGYEALEALDAAGGGVNIEAGTTFVRYAPSNVTTSYTAGNTFSNSQGGANNHVGFKIFTQRTKGITSVTGSQATPVFSSGESIIITVSRPGQTPYTSGAIVISGTTASAFVQAVLGANVPNLSAEVANSGAVTLKHLKGGIIVLTPGTGPGGVGASTAISSAGFSASVDGIVEDLVPAATGSVVLSNFYVAPYTYSATTPTADPASGTLWYYNNPTAVDIMINVGGANGWKGYKTIASDARGYNLTLTDANGVIISPTEPEHQSKGPSYPLRSGDLWLDTSDLENYPRILRYDEVIQSWVLINNADRITQNGIVFADARWGNGSTVSPTTGVMPSTIAMLSSDHVDPDCPDSRLYPRGTLLFNTRRSGYTVKRFVKDYFNILAFPGNTMTQKSTWISTVAFDNNNRPYMGRRAQRNEVIEALKSSIDSTPDLREESYNYNLLVCPGYPEVIANLTALNNDRGQTGFIIGDTPMTMRNTPTAFISHSDSEALTSSPYIGLYYPSGLTNDLDGNEIAVPPSHMMLRTFLYSDQVSYPWFAPAGVRRGAIDNVNAIGFVDARSNIFVKTGLNNGLRDVLYQNRLNPIASLPGTGIVAYGQKTRFTTGSALDRINVARLTNYLRSVFTGAIQQFLFEPNDKITRDQVKQAIESLLNDLIAKRGIYDYVVVCDETNNTSDRIARNELYVDIAIEPMRAIEFIYIPIRIRNPGAITGTSLTTGTA